MALTKYKIGELIIPYKELCGNSSLKAEDVSGVNADKEFFEPSRQVGSDTSNYKNVPPDYFACNLMHVGRDKALPIALNHTNKKKVVSPAYTIFSLKDENRVLTNYFFMMMKSTERERSFWFHTDASVRDGMSWDDFCDIELNLPPLSIQQKYVDVYQALLANQKSYEEGLDDLKLTCFGTIEKLRKTCKSYPIGNYIEPYSVKNKDGVITLEQGINVEKQFITPQRSNSNLKGRKIVRHGMFAYCTQLNNANVAIAYRTGGDCIVSSVYDVFQITEKENLLPGYLMLWLIRPEFGRFVYWASEGSAYEFLNFDNLANYKIPIPDIKTQKAISDIYAVYTERRAINERLKERIKKICPILIKGSLDEGERCRE